MARDRRRPKAEVELNPAAVMAGVLTLLVDEREERLQNGSRKAPPKTEVLLANAGLKTDEVALVMGKTVDAVRKTLQRERKTSGAKVDAA